jgi:predicted permease
MVVRLVSTVVPTSLRERWVAEWEAELEHAWTSALDRGEAPALVGVRLIVRAIESIPDALWLRRRETGGGRGAVLRDATRALIRSPGYSLTVIGILALGIGSSTGIFTVVDALFLRPLPFYEPDRLVALSSSAQSPRSLDWEALAEWRSQERLFLDVRAHLPANIILTGAGEARRAVGRLVEPGLLDMMGIRPVLGRGLTSSDAVPGNHRVVLLGDELWGAAFGRDSNVVGRTIELDEQPYTIIGVLPPTLRFLPPAVVSFVAPMPETEDARGVLAIGRLQGGLSLEVARARLQEVSLALSKQRPREQGWSVVVAPLKRLDRPDLRNGLLALGGGVLSLLLIACTNAAGLLVLRGVGRRREIEIRLALGASRGSLLAQVLTESVMLAIAAGVAGMLLAWCSVQALLVLLPPSALTFSYTVVSIDRRVLLFALSLTLLTGLGFGTIPALRATRATTARSGVATTPSREEVRLRAGMQVAQLALTVLLLSGAGLFGRSFQRIMAVPLGYDVDHLLRLDLVSLERLRGGEARVELARSLQERLRALPGVEAVSRADGVGFAVDYTIQTEDGETQDSGADLLPFTRVDTAYFRTMGISVLEGRGFDASDLSRAVNTVIVDRDLAGALWPGRSALSRRFRIRDGPWLRVVGVTEDVKLAGPLDPLGPYLLFYPAGQEELRNQSVLVRASGNPAALMPAVRQLVREMDAEQPIASLKTGREMLAENVADPRLLLVVMVALAAAALTLSAVGVYGLVSFAVEERRREIGVRMALGAHAGRVVRSVLGWGIVLASLGIAVGLAATLVVSRLVAGILFGTSPLDPTSLVTAAAMLLVTCAAAVVRPALRAASMDPAEVLRAE